MTDTTTVDIVAEQETKDNDSARHIVINDSTTAKSRWYVVHTYSGHENTKSPKP